MIILETLGYLLLLWIFFIFAANMKDRYEDKPWTHVPKWFATAFIAVFFACDIAYNVTFGTLLFLDKPNIRRLTLTARMKDYIHSYSNSTLTRRYRKPLAVFICKYMVEPWDRGHCSL